MNVPTNGGAFLFAADGTSSLGPDAEKKMGVSEANGHSFD